MTELPQLCELVVAANVLTSLPDLIPMRTIASLDLAQNRLERLPPSLFACETLVALDVSWNRLSTLGDVGRLTRLQELRFSEKPLRSFPEAVAQLPLRFLELDLQEAKLLPPGLDQRAGLVLQVL